MVFASNNSNLFSDVVEPLTEKPFSINSSAKGSPSQPQPNMEILLLIICYSFFATDSRIKMDFKILSLKMMKC